MDPAEPAESARHAEAECRLCHTVGGHALFSQDKRRQFLQCPVCDLVFVEDRWLLSAEAEKAEYDLHENNPADEGYRKFLSRAVNALLKHLPPSSPLSAVQTAATTDSDAGAAPVTSARGAVASSEQSGEVNGCAVLRGLDFGCGPGPALDALVREARPDCHVALYDIFYHPDASVLAPAATSGGRYDFITMTEVIEHLHDARQVLGRLWPLLKDGGLLVVMTKRVVSPERFHNWHYKNDQTHVAFFSERTFQWLVAEEVARSFLSDMEHYQRPTGSSALGRARMGMKLHVEGADVVVLEKVLLPEPSGS